MKGAVTHMALGTLSEPWRHQGRSPSLSMWPKPIAGMRRLRPTAALFGGAGATGMEGVQPGPGLTLCCPPLLPTHSDLQQGKCSWAECCGPRGKELGSAHPSRGPGGTQPGPQPGTLIPKGEGREWGEGGGGKGAKRQVASEAGEGKAGETLMGLVTTCLALLSNQGLV